MPRHVGLKDVLRFRDEQLAMYQQAIALSKSHVDKIAKHESTQILTYKSTDDQCRKAFDFVDKKFPEASVKSVTIYVCSRAYIDRLGYKGVGGFFNRLMKVVVIPDNFDFKKPHVHKKTWGTIRAKIERDEVIVHELLHYVSDTKGASSSSHIEEEFAYGNSYPYLKSKGYTDDEIIERNFLPYLVVAIDRSKIAVQVLFDNGYGIREFKVKSPESQKRIMKKLEMEHFRRCKASACDMGREIIRIYCGEDEETEVIVDRQKRKFDMLDL